MTLCLLIAFILAEAVFLIVNAVKKCDKNVYRRNRCLMNLGELVFFLIILLIKIVDWSIRFKLLFAVLVLRVMISGIFYLIRRNSDSKYFRMRTAVVRLLFNTIVMIFALIPAFVINDYQGLPTTGPYEVETISDIFVDQSRKETFEDDGSYREVPVQFWYPKTTESEKFPVIFFSHGAFGYRESNYSTYEELASHGYVVCSMDHPYHSFFTEDTSGKTIIVNFDFMKDVMNASDDALSKSEILEMSKGWLAIRQADMNFVVDTTLKKCSSHEAGVYALINSDKIGLMGHSLGGATSVALGRERDDIDAVIDLDGTMFSEELAWDGKQYLFEETPYPVPLLSIDNELHHENIAVDGDLYVNGWGLSHAVNAKETYFKGAAHMNFTDLPLFSDVLADMLGTGTIDKVHCIETMNRIVLNYFNQYLKDGEEADIAPYYE